MTHFVASGDAVWFRHDDSGEVRCLTDLSCLGQRNGWQLRTHLFISWDCHCDLNHDARQTLDPCGALNGGVCGGRVAKRGIPLEHAAKPAPQRKCRDAADAIATYALQPLSERTLALVSLFFAFGA